MNTARTVLVTGAAGFIGFHLSKKLLEGGHEVVGLDNLNDYYDVGLKKARLSLLTKHPKFHFAQVDIKDAQEIDRICRDYSFETMINLAAQAGVRYSIVNPYAYLDSNLVGFLNVLEAARRYKPNHLIFASSSSVYGANKKMPFSVSDNVDHPYALYAASKKSNELMAHAYANLYALPVTGLRFFTVYGPYGRPDMALFLFTKAILEGKPIDVYNFGKMKRDFTYVDDIVESIVRLISRIPKNNPQWNGAHPDPSSSFAPYRIYNIGNNKPVELLHFISVIEENLGKKAIKNFLPMQAGDMEETFAEINDLTAEIGYAPKTSIETGISRFVDWYREYYKVK